MRAHSDALRAQVRSHHVIVAHCPDGERVQKFQIRRTGAIGRRLFCRHGMETGGHDYLIPVDAGWRSIGRDDSDHASIGSRPPFRREPMRLGSARCVPNNPFRRRMKRNGGPVRAVERGLKAKAGSGHLVVFATRGGETSDERRAQHTPFAARLHERDPHSGPRNPPPVRFRPRRCPANRTGHRQMPLHLRLRCPAPRRFLFSRGQ